MYTWVADELNIFIKGERKVLCGNTARFLVELNPAEPSNCLVTWQKVRGSVTEQIDTSIEKYRGSYDRQLVINYICKEDEGEYQAVLSRISTEKNHKIFSNLIFLLPLTCREGIAIHYSYVVQENSPKVQQIEWRRNGTTLDLKKMKYDGGGLNDSSVTIMSPNIEDKGNNTCTVTNAVGSVTNNVMFGNDGFYFLH